MPLDRVTRNAAGASGGEGVIADLGYVQYLSWGFGYHREVGIMFGSTDATVATKVRGVVGGSSAILVG